MAKPPEVADLHTESLAGKYLTFLLSNEEYGVEILKVQEIIQMQNVTPVPGTPEYVRGVINLRGKVISVIELRKKFSMKAIEDTEKTVIVVILIEKGDTSVTTGIIIDDVKEVIDVDAESIEKTPDFGNRIDSSLIMGIYKAGNSVKMLLNIDKVLSEDVMHTFESVN